MAEDAHDITDGPRPYEYPQQYQHVGLKERVTPSPLTDLLLDLLNEVRAIRKKLEE